MSIDCAVPCAPPPELTISPPGDSWGVLLTHNTSEFAHTFRAELGLPTDRPVIMSGHQAQVWHPGILSKYLAMSTAAEILGAHPAWLVVDQDTGEPTRLRYATSDPSSPQKASSAELANNSDHPGDAPTGLRQPATVSSAVPSELRQIAAALRAHENADSLSEQVQCATEDLLEPIVQPVQHLSALDIRRTSLFREFIGWLRESPEACREAYNRAITGVHHSGVRPLRAGTETSGPEVPLWVLRDGVRKPAFARDLETCTPDELAPRGLTMTGLMRLGACDLFIHGLGGGVYDQVTDRWLEGWLGEGPGALAPSVVVSATIRLGGDVDLRAVEEAEELTWRAHAARHNPALLGDESAAAEKRALLESMETASPDQIAGLYRHMHELLERVRREHKAELARMEERAARARALGAAARRDAEIARDRTLAFPLYPQDRLLALKKLVRDALAT